MAAITLEQARKCHQEGKKLGTYGDILTHDDVNDIEVLKNFVGNYLATQYSDIKVENNTIYFEMYE